MTTTTGLVFQPWLMALGVLGRAEQPVAVGVQLAAMRPDEFFERDLVAVPCRGDETHDGTP